MLARRVRSAAERRHGRRSQADSATLPSLLGVGADPASDRRSLATLKRRNPLPTIDDAVTARLLVLLVAGWFAAAVFVGDEIAKLVVGGL